MKQKEVVMKAINRTIVELQKRLECFKTEKVFLLQKNEEVFQGPSLMRIHSSERKKSLVKSEPEKIIGIALGVEETSHKWC